MSVILHNINATQGEKKIHSNPLNSKHTSPIKTLLQLRAQNLNALWRKPLVKARLVWDGTRRSTRGEVKGKRKSSEEDTQFALHDNRTLHAYPAQNKRYQLTRTPRLPVDECLVTPTELHELTISTKGEIWSLCECRVILAAGKYCMIVLKITSRLLHKKI
jgi:hypothetical protein